MIYNRGNWERIEEIIRKLVEEKREEHIIIGGDFNIRLEQEGGLEELGKLSRKFKDKTIRNGGKKLINPINEVRGYMINGTVSDDEKGEYTYIGARGCSVIDYVIVNKTCNNRLEFVVNSKINSDHLPLTLSISRNETGENGKEESRITHPKRKTVCRWDEEAKRIYKERTKEESWMKNKEEKSTEKT